MSVELGRNLEDRQIAVFGGTSKIGSKFAIEAARRGAEIVAFERNPARFPLLPPDVDKRRITHVEGDITDKKAVFTAVQGRKLDTTINFAAVFNQSSDIGKSWPVNVQGEEHVLEASEEYSVKRHVFISTSGVFIEDNNAYKVTKLEAEKRVQESNIAEWVILRYSNVIGTRDPNDLWNKPFITFRLGDKVIGIPKIPAKDDAPFPYVTLNTAVEATLASLNCSPNQTITVFDGVITVGKYLSAMQEMNEIDRLLKLPPVLMVRAIGIGNFILGKRFPITYGTAKFLLDNPVLENETMERELGIVSAPFDPV